LLLAGTSHYIADVEIVRRKILCWLATVLLSYPVIAQETKRLEGERSFLSFHAGVSFPIICYGSSDINSSTAGFAKPGFIFDLGYVYRFNTNLGVTGSLFYCSNKAGNNNVQASSSPGSYRFFGILAGPFITKNLASRWDGDIRLLAGVARVLTPNLRHEGETILNENKATAFTWGGGLAIRYQLSDKSFLSLKTDHINLKPQFNLKPGETGKGEQHIVVMNVDAGIGLKF